MRCVPARQVWDSVQIVGETLTICFTLFKDLVQIYDGFSDEFRLPRVIGVAEEPHRLAAFDLAFLRVLGRRERRCSSILTTSASGAR